MARDLGCNRIREKNQFTLPSELIHLLGLQVGDELCFVIENDQVVLKKVKNIYEDFKL